MIIRTATCFLIFLLFCLSCAKQSTPTGGPKDTIPPILVKSFPANKELNFKGKKIELHFSEMIILNNPKEQIIITPAVGKDFKTNSKKTEVTLAFETDFKDSTTYTINFRDAVQDITEKNPVRNLQLAFSTGTYIDSLFISGKVYDILKDKPIKDATVALFENIDTLNIFKHKPLYIAKSNEKGLFKIENLKAGKYFIYAFQDKNKNLIVDSKNESYGFIAKTLDLTENIKDISIPIQRLDARPLKLTSARPYNNYFNIKTSKNITDYKLTSDSLKLISCFGEDRANIRVYNFIGDLDSLNVAFNASDSLGNSMDTSFFIKFSKRKVDLEKFAMSTNSKIIADKGLLEMTLSFSKPIATINLDSLFFQPDSTTILHFTEQEMEWEYPTNTVHLKKVLNQTLFATPAEQTVVKQQAPNEPAKKIIKNLLKLGKGAFISIDGDSSANKTENIKPLTLEDTGIILVTIKTEDQHFLTMLLSRDFKPIDKIENLKSLKFENLIPNTYMLKLIIDKNGNGKWDSGNYFKKEEPEPLIFYKNEKTEPLINLKANWELGPLLITY